ncbi:hypothetical protein GCM10010339_31900 [Streptomyces alanosinicus]|uniref:Uncharacterized protein n=1 Tax=Streptomyces alanosinicus TaxID=68171 RepID=A0A918YIT2_9ACTN|nr:hypothetical protein GCM10010339_31900 [Streptomyces alanosinicus]
MHLAPTRWQQRLRAELRAYLYFCEVLPAPGEPVDARALLRRTDPEAPEHRGISVLLVPADAPGFSWTPIETVGGQTATATSYDGVHVPAGNLVGAEHDGWSLITGRLTRERVALAALGMQAEEFPAVALAAARTPDRVNQRRRIDEPRVRLRAAEAHARLVRIACSAGVRWPTWGRTGRPRARRAA